MKKYIVLVTADTTVSARVVVEASSVEHAESLALSVARNYPTSITWEEDEGSTLDPYIADPGNSAEEA